MADQQTTAAPAANPAEVSKTESTANVQSESKTETSDSKPEEKANKTGNGEEKWEVNGKSEDKNGRRNDRRGGGRGGREGGRGGRGNLPREPQQEAEQLKNLIDLPSPIDPNDDSAPKSSFHFSAQNLATDEHMFKVLEGPKNTPALRESNDLDVVDDGEYSKAGSEAVKRKEPLSVPTKESDEKNPPTTEELFYRLKNNSSNNMERSAYVKGFVMVRKRRENDGAWKGSVFVEFDSEDSQKQFLELDPTPKFNGNDLVTMGKKEYIVMKCQEKGIKPDWELTEEEKYQQRKAQREANGDFSRSGRGGGRGQGRGGRGGRGGNDRRDNRRDRNRSRSPRRRRDRSASNGSVDADDWNKRRDRFKDGKDDRASHKEDKKEIERDAHGVPIVKDTSNKRKADDGEPQGSPEKSKLEIKQDE
ncbi:unnamed protein product [Alternaria alternata]